ncbi:hypothetical protein ACS0TY_034275 [Phlomoides rotata]
MKKQLVFAFKFLTLTGVYMFTRSRTPASRLGNPEKSLAVLFLLENLKRIFLYNGRLIKDSKNEVDNLANDILLFKAFLKDNAKRQDKDGALEELEAEIQKWVAEAEDVTGVYSNKAAENRNRNFFQKAFGDQKLISAAKDVRAMRAKVKIIQDKSRVVIHQSEHRRAGA